MSVWLGRSIAAPWFTALRWLPVNHMQGEPLTSLQSIQSRHFVNKHWNTTHLNAPDSRLYLVRHEHEFPRFRHVALLTQGFHRRPGRGNVTTWDRQRQCSGNVNSILIIIIIVDCEFQTRYRYHNLLWGSCLFIALILICENRKATFNLIQYNVPESQGRLWYQFFPLC